MNEKLNRRSFIKSSMVGALAGSALLQGCQSSPKSFTHVKSARPIGANDDVRVAVVGFHSKGAGHIKRFLTIPGVRLVALCDPDQDVIDKQVAELAKQNVKVETYRDIRKLLENPDIDAISTASPNHWHALISVWACQAGKDVYVEKPCSHNVWEGRQIVNAAKRYNRIVQIGTQSRSDQGLAEAIAWIQAGNLGRIQLVRGLCYKRRESIGRVAGPTPIPSSVDYDLWCGPSAKVPLMRKHLHYDWHWVHETGNGDMGNQGIHQMDICRWVAGHDKVSPRVMSIGGRFGYVDDGNTPNTQYVYHDYDGIPIIFETRGLGRTLNSKASPIHYGISVGNIVHCEGGWFAGNKAYDKDGKTVKQFKTGGGEDHQDNFIKAVRSRKESDLNAPILGGHISSALCHTGMISHQIGKETSPEEIRERVESNKYSMETYERFLEHLKINEVDTRSERATLGPWLKMDPDTERFVGMGWTTRRANHLLTRDYREPFVVPDLS